MAKLVRNTCILFILSLPGWAATGWSKEPNCHRCGCCEMNRECRPVVTTKFVTEDYWDSAKQSLCILHIKEILPVGRGHGGAIKGKGEMTTKADSDALRYDAESRYEAKPRCRNRLIRKKCVTEVPVIGWVTQYVCPQCGHKTDCAEQPPKSEPLPNKQALDRDAQPTMPIRPPTSSRPRSDIDVFDPH